MSPTRIGWTHRPGTTGESWNPVWGCTPVSEACDNCYAKRDHARQRNQPWWQPFHEVTTLPHRLDKPLHWRKPRTVFVGSMTDLFHPDVPFSYIAQVFDIMSLTPRHTYLLLTKRPERLLEFERSDHNQARNYGYMGWTPNVWAGTTVELQRYAAERLDALLQVPAPVHFVSAEPLLGELDLAPWLRPGGLGWVIVGGESGPTPRTMEVPWAQKLMAQCELRGVPFFCKQMSGTRREDRQAIPEVLQRKEFPTAS